MDDWTTHLRRTVLVANRKGGVLKSSLVRSVASETQRAGYRVLVVDGDPQGNLSKIDFGLGDDEGGAWEADRGRNLAMALQFGTPLVPVSSHDIDVICGGPDLQGVLGAAMVNPDLVLHDNLRASLGRLCAERSYDLVLIDTGPGDTKLLDAYMLSSRWLVVPVVAGDEASFDGLDKIGARYADLVRSHGAEIQFLGSVLTLVDPKAPVRNRSVVDELAESLGTAGTPFQAMIRYLPAARTDARKYGLSAAEVAEKAVEMKRGRLAALRRRAREAKELDGGKHKADKTDKTDKTDKGAVVTPLGNPDEPWWTRDGAGLAGDYKDLTREILTRMADREARVG